MLALVVTGLMAQAHATAWPDFSDYPAQTPVLTSSKPLRLLRQSHWLARRYPSAIRHDLQANPSPNFAGHYRVSMMGCGTACKVIAITDLRTGRVSGLPGSANHPSGSSVVFANPISWLLPEEQPLTEFRQDSNLLILSGCLEGRAPAGFHSFVMHNGQLKRLRFDRPPLSTALMADDPTLDQQRWNDRLDQECSS